MSVKVAWVSRHPPLKSQLKELESRLGKVEVVPISKTFTSAEEVLNAVKSAGCSYAVVVLPLSIVANLVNDKSITWLWAEMKPVHSQSCVGILCPEYNSETDVILESPTFNRHLRFTKFYKIKEVKMVLEEL